MPKTTIADIVNVQYRLFEQNKEIGWWDGLIDNPKALAASVPVKIALIHSEISEAYEGILLDAMDAMDDHLPEFPMYQVEIADAVIRALDLMGALDIIPGINEEWGLPDLPAEATTFSRRALCLMDMHLFTSRAMEADRKGRIGEFEENMSKLVTYSFSVAIDQGWDLMDIIDKKVTYNGQRADHKRSNRAKAGGKQY